LQGTSQQIVDQLEKGETSHTDGEIDLPMHQQMKMFGFLNKVKFLK
jgi:hypothetical protein